MGPRKYLYLLGSKPMRILCLNTSTDGNHAPASPHLPDFFLDHMGISNKIEIPSSSAKVQHRAVRLNTFR